MDNTETPRIMEILIIRSTSMQHLALVVRKLRTAYPNGTLDVLAHGHSLGSVGEMDGIRSIVPYPASQYFSPFLLPASLKNYDMVVVPTSNITGSGYENVLLLALRLKKKNICLCNLGGELILLPTKKILKMAVLFFMSIPMAILGSLFFLTVNLLLLAGVAIGANTKRLK